MEEWKDVEGYSKYCISSTGRVKSVGRWIAQNNKWGGHHRCYRKPKILKPWVTKCGYLSIRLYPKEGKGDSKLIHRLVANAFIPNPERKPCVNHIDGNKENNSVENLEWCTHRENTIHGHQNGLMNPAKGRDFPNTKLSKKNVLSIRGRYLNDGATQQELADCYNVTQTCISDVVNNITWKHV